ncbi:MAG: sulfate permease [Rhodospirillales bacterium CG15_BIG_FIL_POST_REV_8_21_14_020_66_15]|nr:MAG: sulfate permease [Rhodospirillales bacterium CG15_BIG_FIL_POST_REV_8_21_14_020_66_15]
MTAINTGHPHQASPPPQGVEPVSRTAASRFPFAWIPVRCRRQAAEALPMYVRPRFGKSAGEISGALGDLGTFLPHIIGAITVVGMAPAGILTTFGLFYIFTGAFYGLPIAVQPMKAASAAVLVEPVSPEVIAGVGLVLGLFFLVAAVTGLIDRLARAIPETVAAGLQLGLGLSLAMLGLSLMADQPWFAAAMCALAIVLLRGGRLPAALIVLGVGTAAGQAFGIAEPFPDLKIGLHLPPLVIPDWAAIATGIEHAVLPQIPLTLTNAIIVTAAVTRQLFPKEVVPVTERNLSLTTGIGNLLAAPFGGYPMCHGAGGVAAHHRFGARTATAPLLIGLMFLALGLFLGDGGYALLRMVPDAVLGTLLLVSGLELALSSKPMRFDARDRTVLTLVGVICLLANPAAAFVAGWPLAFTARRLWPRR